MRFGKNLKHNLHRPWAEHYIDYTKLKKLLREHGPSDRVAGGPSSWTEQDEESFVQELLNSQLDKVSSFQSETYQRLRDRMAACEQRLHPLVADRGEKEGDAAEVMDTAERRKIAEEALKELDAISSEVNLLEKFCRVNFTGFLKAAKKHDHKRGSLYKVRPLLQVRLAQTPFNTEDFTPFLYRLSTMYAFVRQSLGDNQLAASNETASSSTGANMGGPKPERAFSSHKFWVHQDNILEVKTLILRHLPVLVYGSDPSSTSGEGPMPANDPSFTTLYFDSPKFALYNQRVDRGAGSTLRLWWRGHLSENLQLLLEKIDTGDDDRIAGRTSLTIKEKHVKAFLNGRYQFDKKIEHTPDPERARHIKEDVEVLQSFIRENDLQPVLRATYNRTAFQIPGDDSVRVSFDTDVALIREDAPDGESPCRDPEDWHRRDIDQSGMSYPFNEIHPLQVSCFPHALLEIRISDDAKKASKRWVADLISSNPHLLKESPRFSKFVHGVAELFDDQVNRYPFWLNDLDVDIRRDPEIAYEEKQQQMAKEAEDHTAIGNFIGSLQTRPMPGEPLHQYSVSREPSYIADSNGYLPQSSRSARDNFGLSPAALSRETSEDGRPRRKPSLPPTTTDSQLRSATSEAPATGPEPTNAPLATLGSYIRRFIHKRRPSSSSDAALPPGVREPQIWLKDQGPVRVELKVWLANQRTFIKWQHVAILLAALSLSLFNAAVVEHDSVARILAVIYISHALFAGIWGWYMYEMRSKAIRARTGNDLNNVAGPFILAFGLMIVLIGNFWLKYSELKAKPDGPDESPTVPDSFAEGVSSQTDATGLTPTLRFINQAAGS